MDKVVAGVPGIGAGLADGREKVEAVLPRTGKGHAASFGEEQKAVENVEYLLDENCSKF